MSRQPFRRSEGGRIDRSRVIEFEFDGRRYPGHPGDTLASALIANGVRLVGRSFKYHRPRGIVACGTDEPNALVRLGRGRRAQPNLRATEIALADGLVASSQNRWPSLRWDLGAIAGWFAPLLPAGFYYKTFMWPGAAWKHYEHAIRRAAGLGRAPEGLDPERYEHTHAQVDVLVAGGGLAGLAAAEVAGEAGVHVMLVDDGEVPGGMAIGVQGTVDGMPVDVWIGSVLERLRAMPNVTLLPRASVSARLDHGELIVLERANDAAPGPAQRRWTIHAGQLVLAAGAAERPIAFVDNDLPGVMLASAACTYAHRYAALPGRRAVVFTNNDSGYAAAAELERAGVEVACVVDTRRDDDGDTAFTASAGLRCRQILRGHAVVRALGRRSVSGCEVMALSPDGRQAIGDVRRIDCDLIASAGGWSPRVHLSCHLGARPRYDTRLAAFLPAPAAGLHPAGACAGEFAPADCVAGGRRAGEAAAAACRPASIASAAPVDGERQAASGPCAGPQAGRHGGPFPERFPGGHPLHASPLPPGCPPRRDRRFVDFQTDVTTRDLELACREGFVSIEHVKRYTALGMGTDQGKTSNVAGLMHVAAVTGRAIDEVGTTTFRPPYTPVTLGAIAGRRVGRLAAPARVSPLHDWHVATGAVFMYAGLWMRAQVFPRPGETEEAAVGREARNVREAVGITDVSPLGKIELRGRDVAELLDRVYINGWQTLAVGRSRYGVMLRPDGMVLDDGTTSRLGDDHYLMTTTTGNAERIYGHLQRCLQAEWPELDVLVEPVTEQWGAMALAGPHARELLQRLEPDFAVDNEHFPYMSVRQGQLGGRPARVFRISFAGELGYEINVPAGLLTGLWQQALERGQPLGVMPYGTEAMMVLRIEKGFFVPGFEADGRVTPRDLGLTRLISTKKAFIGKAALRREALSDPQRPQLVGVLCEDPAQALPRGAQLVAEAVADVSADAGASPSDGHLTSMAFSPALGRWIGLALLRAGGQRHGERLIAVSPIADERVAVRIVAPVFFDPEGVRTNA